MINILKLLISTDRELFKFYTKLLGRTPRNINFYKVAMTHRSYSNGKRSIKNNERMEFLGDAILESIVSDTLYSRFPTKDEGFLTKLRAVIVRRETLSKIGREMGLEKYIRISSSIPTASIPANIYGNAVEALIAAIYLDFGYNLAAKIVKRRILDRYLKIDELRESEHNHKSRLIEWAQKRHLRVIFTLDNLTRDEQHNNLFKTSIIIAGERIATGVGVSKKLSHQDAAHNAIELIESNSPITREIINKNNSDK